MTSSLGSTPPLSTRNLSVGYGKTSLVLQDVTVAVPPGKVTAIIGPNGCGKSTLLKAMAGLISPYSGTVELGGKAIHQWPRRQVAQRLAYLPQSVVVPDGVTVRELVARGRHPHQSWLRQWSPTDDALVDQAMYQAGCADLADRPVAQLSGGQRQRAWLGLVLAQGAETLLLDEPTTFLDLATALEVLRAVRGLAESVDHPRTVVMVLHDINLAARFADYMVCLGRAETKQERPRAKATEFQAELAVPEPATEKTPHPARLNAPRGDRVPHLPAQSPSKVLAEGTPAEVIAPELLQRAFCLNARVIDDPVTGGPLVVPE